MKGKCVDDYFCREQEAEFDDELHACKTNEHVFNTQGRLSSVLNLRGDVFAAQRQKYATAAGISQAI